MNILDCVIIGSGFGGLGIAARLKASGFDKIAILERAQDVGGTWRENTYPGCCCDIPSHLYWYSFDRRPDWTRHYALQPEILANIRDFVARRGLAAAIRFGFDVVEARWSEKQGLWRVLAKDGRRVEARCLVSATGQLSNPSFRDVPGRDRFDGESFHSAQWRQDVSLAGKAVAVVGVGASAIQIIPEVAKVASRMMVFQRSAPYVMPRGDHAYTESQRRAFGSNEEGAYETSREAIFTRQESLHPALKVGSEAARAAMEVARSHLESQVADPVLRERLWPDYEIGCKRVLVSDEYYPALCRSNTELVDAAIESVEPAGIRTKDGVLHEADVIVYATGFESTKFLSGIAIHGEGGKTLHGDAWREAPVAYKGVTVSGFPNLFLVYGPNTNLNHNSIISMMEAQYEQILQLFDRAASGASAVSVKQSALDAYNRQLEADLSRLAFGSGCNNWYRSANGKITNNWSGTVLAYQDLLGTVQWDDFEFRHI